jgi:hypothetical protein
LLYKAVSMHESVESPFISGNLARALRSVASMPINYNNHEWEALEPCKFCGMSRDEILQSPDRLCTGFAQLNQDASTSLGMSGQLGQQPRQ